MAVMMGALMIHRIQPGLASDAGNPANLGLADGFGAFGVV